MVAAFHSLSLMPLSAHWMMLLCWLRASGIPRVTEACVPLLCLSAAEAKPAAAGHQEAPGILQGTQYLWVHQTPCHSQDCISEAVSRMHACHLLLALSPSALLAAQVPRRSLSQQGIDRRLDSAGDTVLGPARRQGISRTALAGFDSALPVIYSAQWPLRLR